MVAISQAELHRYHDIAMVDHCHIIDDGIFAQTFLGADSEYSAGVVLKLQTDFHKLPVFNIHAQRYHNGQEHLGTKVDMRISVARVREVVTKMTSQGYTFLGRDRTLKDIYYFVFHTPRNAQLSSV